MIPYRRGYTVYIYTLSLLQSSCVRWAIRTQWRPCTKIVRVAPLYTCTYHESWRQVLWIILGFFGECSCAKRTLMMRLSMIVNTIRLILMINYWFTINTEMYSPTGANLVIRLLIRSLIRFQRWIEKTYIVRMLWPSLRPTHIIQKLGFLKNCIHGVKGS